MPRSRLVLAAVTYFGLVFTAGFLLGTLRVLWLEPALGTRWAELLELPVMIVACWFAAGWTVRRFAVPPHALPRLVVGGLALLLLLAAELGVLVFVRGSSAAADVASRDPVSGTAYLLSLLVFALLPLFVARNEDTA